MKCNCCNNKVWVEPNTNGTITIYTERSGLTYGYTGTITTGITVSFADAIEFSNQIRIAAAIEYTKKED